MMKTLTIAGFDPSGGAGIQADLKVFQYLHVYGLSVATALTAQNTRGVQHVFLIRPDIIRTQLNVILSDLKPESTKMGMLYNESTVKVVASIIRKYSLSNIVLDPVLLSSTGKRLVQRNTPVAIRKKLVPLCTVLTPNIHEASVLSGIPIKTDADIEKAAVRLKDYGAENILITGGHLEKSALDIFYDGTFHHLRSKKIKGDFHGTGCTLSSAIAAFLALGKSPLEAAKLSKKFMNTILRKPFDLGSTVQLLNI